MDTKRGDDSFELVETSIAAIHRAFDRDMITAASLVEHYLERIEEYDDELNAILTVNPAAKERAQELDQTLESDGIVGPLHGVPVVLKDNHDTGDLPTTAGVAGLDGSIPRIDASVVARIRDAGGVVLAKANLHELSYGVDTISSLGGTTRNAYDLDRRPSGSSGGTAVAIAANLGTIGTGTDTCSSVRSPPAFNALVGVRPTRGLVSRTGIVPLSDTQDTVGPITRTVADAARLLDAIVGYDPADPVTATGVGNVPADGYRAHLDKGGLEGARIGVVRSLFELADDANASPAAAASVRSVVDEAIDAMAAAGATVVDPVGGIDLDELDRARVIEFEFARDFDRYLDRRGDAVPYDTLAELVASSEVDEPVAERIQEGDTLEVDVDGLDENAAYLQRLHNRDELALTVLNRMADADVDALVYPPSTIPPVEIPENQPFEELRCKLSSHTGLPAIVVPAGFTENGLPVGIELLGRRFAESRLFELAFAFEQETDHRVPPPGFAPLDRGA